MATTMTFSILASLDDLDPAEYRAFFVRSQAPLFYDRRFLLAAEHAPLLPVHNVFYVLARDAGQLVAVVPAYLQDIGVVDPLKVLAGSVGLSAAPGDRALFSHIMHCFDSTMPTLSDDPRLYAGLFDTLAGLAQTEGARYFGLLNVKDGPVLREAQRHGLNLHHMVDKYAVDLTAFRDFDHFVQALPAEGRREMVRQLRKFDSSGMVARIVAPPFDDMLEQLASLCHLTTARLGTPQYWPAEPLARFCRQCGDLIRLSVIEADGRLLSGFICFEEAGTLHVWTAGMDYEQTEFSPYSIGFATAYRHAFERGLKRVEGGRLNARIKTRLGLKPVRLYAITSTDLHAPAATGRDSGRRSRTALAGSLDGELRPAAHPAFTDWYHRIAWNGRDFHRHPTAIVRAQSDADVAKAIVFAREQGLRVSVRGGGHSYAGSFLRADTLLLDLSGLDRVTVDVPRARATVEPGVSGGQLSAALGVHGLAFPTGHGRQVTVGGFLLGGGLGINCTAWGGMSVFNVEALDLVTADGQLRHVDAQHDPALFWAARGGGPASFFAVTRFYVRCWPAPGVVANSVYTVPFSALGDLLAGIERAAPPPHLQIMLAATPPASGGGTPTLVLNTIAYAPDLAQARQLREALLAHLPPRLDTLEEDQSAGFEALYRQTDAMTVSRRYRTDNILTDRTHDIAPILTRHLARSPSAATTALVVWRGRPTYPDAAFSAQGRFFVSTYAQWNDARDDARNRDWLKGLYDELGEIAASAYINEFDLEQRAADVHRCFAPANWARLKQLRREYDPDGLFVDIETLALEAAA